MLTEMHNPIAKQLFGETNQRIEWWSKITYTFFIKFIIPLGFIGLYIASLYFYYVKDMGSDGFILLECLW